MKYIRYMFNYLVSFLYDVWYFLFGNMRSRVQGVSYYKASKMYPDYLKSGNMMIAIDSLALRYCNGSGVDIGAGKWPFAGARAIEDGPEENAYHIHEKDAALDFVFSSHSLEHLTEWKKALGEWHRVLRPGGVLFLYLPHPACHMWDVGVNPQHVWRLTPNEMIDTLTNDFHMHIEYETFLPDGFLSFVIVAKK